MGAGAAGRGGVSQENNVSMRCAGERVLAAGGQSWAARRLRMTKKAKLRRASIEPGRASFRLARRPAPRAAQQRSAAQHSLSFDAHALAHVHAHMWVSIWRGPCIARCRRRADGRAGVLLTALAAALPAGTGAGTGTGSRAGLTCAALLALSVRSSSPATGAIRERSHAVASVRAAQSLSASQHQLAASLAPCPALPCAGAVQVPQGCPEIAPVPPSLLGPTDCCCCTPPRCLIPEPGPRSARPAYVKRASLTICRH